MMRKAINRVSKSMMTRRAYSSSATAQSEEVLVTVENGVSVLELNRPKALNALNLNMVRLMQPVYENNSRLYVLKSSNAQQKAFCAGGDIKDIYYTKNSQFFDEEYTLDYTIGTLDVPHVSILDGITMGGGVGVSVHGSTRIATENTVFAMPETQIGFFCDVGGGHFLARLDNHWGMWLALTGSRLKGQQVAATGVATHFIPREKLPELQQFLFAEAANLTKKNVNSAIDSVFQQDRQAWKDTVDASREKISQIFGKPSVKQIIDALEKSGDEFSQTTLAQLDKMSPTSLRVVHRQVTLGGHLDLKQVFDMERGIAHEMLQEHDFYEGVRSLLVDKDSKFAWKPAKLEQIQRSDVDAYFTGVPESIRAKIPQGEEY